MFKDRSECNCVYDDACVYQSHQDVQATILERFEANISALLDINVFVTTISPQRSAFDLKSVRNFTVRASGVFYSPRHIPSFPLEPAATIDVGQIAQAIDADLASIKPYFGVVRTAQATYFGVDIAPIAKKNDLRLYLGVNSGQDSPDSYEDQVAAAIAAVLAYPDTVQAILVGSDNVRPYGEATAADITARVLDLKKRVEVATGSVVPIGTSQRADSWLSMDTDLSALASVVDIIGVETYPYLDPDFSTLDPLALLERTWVSLASRYPEDKLLITATGHPTGSENPPVRVELNPENAQLYFVAFAQSTFAGFWAAFFDLRLDDPITRIGMPQVKSFGLVTDAGDSKDMLPSLEFESGAMAQFTPAAAANYPSTIKAILVGNENVIPCGPYKADEIIASINSIRTRIRQGTGRNVAVGTVQRATEWLNPNIRGDMLRLAASSDIIGVNIYPFFDGGYNPDNPLGLLDAIWNQMLALYPASKLRLTEIGYPTGGTAPSFAPKNTPSLQNSVNFYNAFQRWSPKAGGGEAFWYSMFDLRADDTTQPADLEKHFGFLTADTRQRKVANYPLLLQTTPPPAPIPAPTPAPTPAPPPAPVNGPRGPQGVLYSPFHADEYPNDLKNVGAAISLDLQLVRTRFSSIRTEYSNFYGVDVTPFAAAVGLKLTLGVGMTRETWYADQVASAVSAVKYFPRTISALTVGSENAYRGDNFNADDIIAAIRGIKARIPNVKVGTVQRAAEWLNPALRADMVRLSQDCDVIGVTLSLYDTDNLTTPAAVAAAIDQWWRSLAALYPPEKLQLMNIGFPTSGATSAKGNIAGVDQA
ncbi:hypothetical protein DYB28_004534, partial [Aphanomyces astaci]